MIGGRREEVAFLKKSSAKNFCRALSMEYVRTYCMKMENRCVRTDIGASARQKFCGAFSKATSPVVPPINHKKQRTTRARCFCFLLFGNKSLKNRPRLGFADGLEVLAIAHRPIETLGAEQLGADIIGGAARMCHVTSDKIGAGQEVE